MQRQGKTVAHAHLRHMRPFPKNLGELLGNYKKVLIPEINNGQLIKIIRDKYMVDAIGFNKIKGNPITRAELVTAISELL
jgi:2-oxoglutarate ferredoxin oxidoreductase subunit alpha